MFQEGNLLYFDPFLFKNGALPKPKFFIVLKRLDEEKLLLATLPTSKDHVPGDLPVKSGCTEDPVRNVNVYVLLKDEVVAIDDTTLSDFSFNMNTFIYGADLDTFPEKSFFDQVEHHETQISFKGKLKDEVYKDLILCLKGSTCVKKKFKKVL